MRALALLSCLTAALAQVPFSDFEGRVVANETLDQYASAVIHNLDETYELSVPVVRNQSFQFHEVPDGDYVLNLYSEVYRFPTHEVSLKAGEPPRLYYHIPGHRRGPAQPPLRVSHPFEIAPTGKWSELEAKKPFSLYSFLLGNPILLLTIVCIGMAMGLPRLLAIIDPETLKEVRQNQAEMHQRMSKMQNVDFTDGLSKFLAGGNDAAKKDTPEAPSAPIVPAATTTARSTPNQNQKKGKKRR